MLDLIITSYKLTINMFSYLQEYIDYTYNNGLLFTEEFSLLLFEGPSKNYLFL